jgi:hypothetical protein
MLSGFPVRLGHGNNLRKNLARRLTLLLRDTLIMELME